MEQNSLKLEKHVHDCLRQVRTFLPHDEITKAFACLTIRFSGESLTHVGNATAEALALLFAFSNTNLSYRGQLIKGAKATTYRTPKKLDKAGSKLLFDSLNTLKKLPAKTHVNAYFKDGDPVVLAPQKFGLYFSLLRDTEVSFSSTGGFLMMGVPLQNLENPEPLIALAEKVMTLLKAEIGWLSPGVWFAPHCLFNSFANQLPDVPKILVPLFGKAPQLDVPSLYATRSPFDIPKFDGFFSPAWIMWADSKLARKVQKFPGLRTQLANGSVRFQMEMLAPFEMSETSYAHWKNCWEAMRLLHLTPAHQIGAVQFFTSRFSAPSLKEQNVNWLMSLSSDK